jgi:four helix bundle suffix protein
MSYRDLLTFQQSEEIYDLTVKFCAVFLNTRQYVRLREQMEQAARSGKQNIAEGASQKTSLQGYIKLVGVARGSLEELLEDYRDIVRQQGLELWGRGDRRVETVKKAEKGKRVDFLFPSSLPSSLSQPSLPLILNYLIDLIIRTNYLLDRQRKALEDKFICDAGERNGLPKARHFRAKEQTQGKYPAACGASFAKRSGSRACPGVIPFINEGGYREQLFKKRIAARRDQ